MLRFSTVIDFLREHWFLGILIAGVLGYLSSILAGIYLRAKYLKDNERWKYEEQERIDEQKFRRP